VIPLMVLGCCCEWVSGGFLDSFIGGVVVLWLGCMWFY
jgi:hypothetical protein